MIENEELESHFHKFFTSANPSPKTTAYPKAEGADFLKTLGNILLWVGILVAVVAGVNALGAGDLAGIAYSAIIVVTALVLYGVCVNLASVNSNIHRMYLLKYKESQKGKEDDLLGF